MAKQVPYAYLDTPAVLIDLDRMEANMEALQKAANEAGVRMRPHTKVHQSVDIARMMIANGAQGIEVGPIAQAEAMADGGIHDILIAHPFYGETKWEILDRLLRRKNLQITACVDMVEQAEGIGRVAKKVGRTMPVLIKLETGIGRFGVTPGDAALKLAQKIKPLAGVEVVGVYAHESGAVPTEEGFRKCALAIGTQVCDTATLLKKNGFDIHHVSVGASATHFATCKLIKEGRLDGITEVHPGNRVFGDLRYGLSGGNTREEIAISVLVTVMSASHDSHVIVDAGWKTMGAEIMPAFRNLPDFWWKDMPSYGIVKGRPDLRMARVAAETGWIYYLEGARHDLKVGDRLEIIPNSANLVVNLHDKIYGIRNGNIEVVFPVSNRGKGA